MPIRFMFVTSVIGRIEIRLIRSIRGLFRR
jgi:hypothetical protein